MGDLWASVSSHFGLFKQPFSGSRADVQCDKPSWCLRWIACATTSAESQLQLQHLIRLLKPCRCRPRHLPFASQGSYLARMLKVGFRLPPPWNTIMHIAQAWVGQKKSNQRIISLFCKLTLPTSRKSTMKNIQKAAKAAQASEASHIA